MSHQSPLVESDIETYLRQHERKELLRVLICGSVDDGKSTLIGRLLHDSKLIYEDQLAAIHRDSRKSGTSGEQLDLALLVDGLQAEREQGITIDVAWRYFSTDRRKFIIADTPGHEQYTRNMATGASTCDLAIVLIDARQGVKEQTRRHTLIARLLGIRHLIIAINKMDLMNYQEDVYEEIKQDFRDSVVSCKHGADDAGIVGNCWSASALDVAYIPVSALTGDNIIHASERMPWYEGETLMHRLEHVPIYRNDHNLEDLRFPVQWVNRPDADFRGYSGTLAAGIVRRGDAVKVLPSGVKSRVTSIVSYDGELSEAYSPMAVTLTLEDDIDVSRGNVIVDAEDDLVPGTSFCAFIVWMSEEPLSQGKEYYIQSVSGSTTCVVRDIGIIDPNGQAEPYLEQMQTSPSLEIPLNGIARASVETSAPLCLDRYPYCRDTGTFILIDRISNVTVGAGMVSGKGVANAAEPKADRGHAGAVFGLIGGGANKVAECMRAAIERAGGHCIALDATCERSPLIEGVLGRGGLVSQLADQGQICLVALSEEQEEAIEALEGRTFGIDPAMGVQDAAKAILFGAIGTAGRPSIAEAVGLYEDLRQAIQSISIYDE
ncbi:MAG: sulfate adenylyltransferase subunit CysN [Candidatus Eutrophobiaceae bacterium]